MVIIMTKIRDLQLHEHELIGDIIGDSFADDPVNQWVFGNQKSMTSYFTKSARKCYLPKGFCQITENENAGAMWLTAGVKKHIPLWNSVDIAISMLLNSGVKSLFNGFNIDVFLDNKKPDGSYFYLFAIGARAGSLGHGYGGMLMESGLAVVDTYKQPTYLECSKESNISFYQRYGFELIEKVIPAENCPLLWLMWRKAV
jgi:ribosomal protein S18 acetylase RimI-like enzyme